MTTLIDLTKSRFEQTKERLDTVSPSFCLAKWTQVTIDLGRGYAASCHNPDKHHIPLDEIKLDPSALHNDSFKKMVRQQMVDGKRPSECYVCWDLEDAKGTNTYSDRITKSSFSWSAPRFDEIVKDPMANIVPSYVEVAFNNTCNLKCAYCNPISSSKWAEEIRQYGPYPTSNQFNNFDTTNLIKQREHNPYIEAFWKWWPELYQNVKVFRITGGEPLLSKHTFDVIDKIIASPREDFAFEINSNLCAPDELIDKLIEKLPLIQAKSKVVYTSCEAYGSKAEYARHGLKYDIWRKNVEKVLATGVKVVIMSAYNALSVTSFNDFVKDMLTLRKDDNLNFNVAHVWEPIFLSLYILDDSFEHLIEEQIKTFEDNNLHDHEINGIKKVYALYKNRIKNLPSARRDFVQYINEHDRRRGTDFLSTFPEMERFFYESYNL